jgi:predicted nucleotidyltransferase
MYYSRLLRFSGPPSPIPGRISNLPRKVKFFDFFLPPCFPLYNPAPITHNTSMKKSLAHLPQSKQDELKLIVNKIDELVNPEKIILFGSYARGDWKDGPHTQGKSRLTIHKKSDYDILVITEDTNTARDPDLWYKITKEKLAQLAPCVKKLHQVTEKICKEKIESFA